MYLSVKVREYFFLPECKSQTICNNILRTHDKGYDPFLKIPDLTDIDYMLDVNGQVTYNPYNVLTAPVEIIFEKDVVVLQASSSNHNFHGREAGAQNPRR